VLAHTRLPHRQCCAELWRHDVVSLASERPFVLALG